ncbi:MAG: methyltransferase domain-containing protein [Bacteroidota bacterium]|nr:methyltransferase domain-containing protein [Bacteroidota bacterium]
MLNPEFDAIGQAVSEYHKTGKSDKILVKTDLAEDEFLDPSYFFRSFKSMPLLERKALQLAKGRILDVGAGAGCHSLYLQEKGYDVHSIDISPLLCNVMTERGIKNVICTDIFQYSDQKFDTILFLMNGIGVAKNLNGLVPLLVHLREILNPGGSILLDSSDIIYLYEDEDGAYQIDLNSEKYYGEITYDLSYRQFHSDPFPWLFVDYETMEEMAEVAGFKSKIVQKGTHFDYLMQLIKI